MKLWRDCLAPESFKVEVGLEPQDLSCCIKRALGLGWPHRTDEVPDLVYQL